MDTKISDSLLTWLEMNMTSLNIYISIDYRLVIEDDFSLLRTEFHGETAILCILVSMKEASGRFKKNCGSKAAGLTKTCFLLFCTLIKVYNDLGQLGKFLQMVMEVSNDQPVPFDVTLASYFRVDVVFEVR